MVLSEPKLIIQAMSMNPRMSFRPQEDVKHSPDETDSVTDKEGSFILEPFTVHCIYIKLQTTWIFTGLPTTPTLSPWTDSSKPYCLKQKRFSSSFCPGTMRSDLWSVRCFGTVGKHHHAPWTADFFWVIRGEDLMEVLGMALKFGDSFRKCRPKWPSWPMCHEEVCQKLTQGMARPTWQALVMEFSLVSVGTVPP